MFYARTIGWFFSTLRDAVARVLIAIGVRPNLLTIIGCIVTCSAGIVLASGHLFAGAVILFFASSFDMLDGAVAKLGKAATKFGGVLDSCLDRLSDGVLFGGLIVYFARIGRIDCVIMSCLAMTGALTTSYVRARAENVIESCKVGFWERPERIVLIMLSLVFNRIPVAIYELGVLSNLTALHRIVHTYEVLYPPAEYDTEPSFFKRIENAIYDIIFWKYDRFTWQYDIAVTCVVVFTYLGGVFWSGGRLP